MGFNDTPDRDLYQCEFNNERFLIYSSIFSFYIPTIAMIILYYRIFKVIRTRAKNAALSKNSTIKNMSKNLSNNNHINNIKTKLLNGSDIEKEKINLLSEGIFKLKNTKTLESNENVNNNNNNNNNDDKKYNNKLNNTTTSTLTSTIDVDKLTRTPISNNTKAGDSVNNLNEIVAETNLNNLTSRLNESNKNMPLLLSNNEKKIVTTTAILNKNKNVEVKKNKTITVQRFQSPAMISTNKERKVTKTLAIVLIVFLVCW